MKLQEQIHNNRSQYVTAGAMMWLQEQDLAAGVKMWLQDKLLKLSFSSFCRNLDFSDSRSFGAALLVLFFC